MIDKTNINYQKQDNECKIIEFSTIFDKNKECDIFLLAFMMAVEELKRALQIFGKDKTDKFFTFEFVADALYKIKRLWKDNNFFRKDKKTINKIFRGPLKNIVQFRNNKNHLGDIIEYFKGHRKENKAVKLNIMLIENMAFEIKNKKIIYYANKKLMKYFEKNILTMDQLNKGFKQIDSIYNELFKQHFENKGMI